MFFDNNKYYDFVKKCRENGIDVPIIPGLILLKTVKQLDVLPEIFNIKLPAELVSEIKNGPEHVEEIGKKWLQHQVEDLISHNVKNIHFFLMNDADKVIDIVSKI